MILSVALPIPVFKTFDYTLPESQTDHPEVSLCSNFLGKRVLVPFSGRELIGIIVAANKDNPDHFPSSYKIKPAIKVLDQDTYLDQKLLKLIQWAAHYYCHPIGEALSTAIPTTLRKLKRDVSEAETLRIVRWHLTIDKPLKNAPKQSEIISLLKSYPNGIWQSTCKLLNISNSLLATMHKKSLLRKEELNPLKASLEKLDHSFFQKTRLNNQQSSILGKLLEEPDTFNINLLYGVTGSGKTEVYIARTKAALEEQKQVLILIPEINLTPQTLNRFQSQLNTPIGLVHSGLSEKEKLTTWMLARSGQARVIIGTRSAIFTPFKKLGLIIVDEEHDHSYKQNDGFKYSARDLAVKRAQIENCQIILGSATPSLESLQNSQINKYHFHELLERTGNATAPDVKLIDIKSRTLQHGCSAPLLDNIKRELSSSNQVIIFQNRRGFAPTLLCNSCNWLATCPFCDARLTVHNNPPHLHCHHCDYKERIPTQCPKCKHHPLSPLGTGTERIEFHLEQLFPGTKVIRIDRDNIKKQSDMSQLIDDINTGEPCILIGTQMLAKGHDFHNVTLVAIIDADSSLFSSDFRAFEHSTQLLMQVAGRSGRGKKRGQVLIQTKFPDHPLFEPILKHDYMTAAKRELSERENCQLPPFSKMISLRAESASQTINQDALMQISHSLEANQINNKHYLIAGPFEATLSKKANIYRSYLHIFTTHPSTRSKIQSLLPQLIETLKLKARIFVDVDPMEYT